MGVTVYTFVVTQVLQALPAPVLRMLDAWSHRVARRRAQERQRRWLARSAPPVVEAAVPYRLKPWRD